MRYLRLLLFAFGTIVSSHMFSSQIITSLTIGTNNISPLLSILLFSLGNLATINAAPTFLSTISGNETRILDPEQSGNDVEKRQGGRIPIWCQVPNVPRDVLCINPPHNSGSGIAVSTPIVFTALSVFAASMEFPLVAALSLGLGQIGNVLAVPVVEVDAVLGNNTVTEHGLSERQLTKPCFKVRTQLNKCGNGAGLLLPSSNTAILTTLSVFVVTMDFPLVAALSLGYSQFGNVFAVPVVQVDAEPGNNTNLEKGIFDRQEPRPCFKLKKTQKHCNGASLSLPSSNTAIFTTISIFAASMDFPVLAIATFGLGQLGNVLATPVPESTEVQEHDSSALAIPALDNRPCVKFTKTHERICPKVGPRKEPWDKPDHYEPGSENATETPSRQCRKLPHNGQWMCTDGNGYYNITETGNGTAAYNGSDAWRYVENPAASVSAGNSAMFAAVLAIAAACMGLGLD